MYAHLFSRKRLVFGLIVIILFSVIAPSLRGISYAAVPSLDNIRAALFIQARGTVPAVTLSSAGGLNIGIRTPAGVRNWFNGPAELRGAIDHYMLYILETSDYQAASSLRNQAASMTPSVSIFGKQGGNGEVYQVAVGPFPTKADAERTLDTLKNQSLAIAPTQRIGGPLYWTTGTFATKNEAEQQVAAMNAAGVQAYVAIHEDGEGKAVYSAWIGGEADRAGLEAIKESASKLLPGRSFNEANTNEPYIIERKDVSAGANSAIPYYSFNANDHNVWVAPADESHRITVKERSGRSYRGAFELTQYSGVLAVINELPFEHYLYAVVGSEMGSGWPLEALKAQAVAARSYALSVGIKYRIAHVSDTTYEQAYHGVAAESPAVIEAVEATRGEILINKSGVIEALYYSNAGGMTADAVEIWGRSLDYAQSVPSPDHNAAEGLLDWYRVILPDGKIGYVRSDYTRDTGRKNKAGLAILQGTANNVNVRNAPYVNDSTNPAIGKINEGDELILLEQQVQSNPFSWTHGPYTGSELLATINRYASVPIKAPLTSLEVSKRGPSGRVTEVTANGQVIGVSSPDTYRTALKGLPSTRFSIENSNSFAVVGASGNVQTHNYSGTLYALSGGSAKAAAVQGAEIFAVSGDLEARVISTEATFRFIGNGYGHGIGLSQYGAKEMAEFLGYDYKRILQYYYHGVDIVKGGQ